MKQKKPVILPVNEPYCYVTPEIMKQFDDELDEEHWHHLLKHIESLHAPLRKRKYEQSQDSGN